MLNFPHPLSADNINIQGLVGHTRIRNVQARTPRKHNERDDERDNSPRDLQTAVLLISYLFRRASRPTPIFHGEIKNENENQGREEGSDARKEKVHTIHTRRDRRCNFRKKGKPNHGSRLRLKMRNAASAKTVATLASLTVFMIASPYFPVSGL